MASNNPIVATSLSKRVAISNEIKKLQDPIEEAVRSNLSNVDWVTLHSAEANTDGPTKQVVLTFTVAVVFNEPKE